MLEENRQKRREEARLATQSGQSNVPINLYTATMIKPPSEKRPTKPSFLSLADPSLYECIWSRTTHSDLDQTEQTLIAISPVESFFCHAQQALLSRDWLGFLEYVNVALIEQTSSRYRARVFSCIQHNVLTTVHRLWGQPDLIRFAVHLIFLRPAIFPTLASATTWDEPIPDERDEELWTISVQSKEEDILFAYVQLLAESDRKELVAQYCIRLLNSHDVYAMFLTSMSNRYRVYVLLTHKMTSCHGGGRRRRFRPTWRDLLFSSGYSRQR